MTGPALERLGTEVGGTAEVAGSDRTLRVVGVVEEIASHGHDTVWALPGALLADSTSEEVPPTIYLAGARPVTWEDVQRLNRRGIVVYSRAVVLDPPPHSEVEFFASGYEVDRSQETLFAVLAVILVVTLAVLEVVLLAGAAFAVGARRQARSLGLVTATGGDSGDVRRVVLAGGVVLGAAGALVGLVLAVALSAATVSLLERYSDQDFGRFDVRPVELAGAALVGLVAAVLASVLRRGQRRDAIPSRRSWVGADRPEPLARSRRRAWRSSDSASLPRPSGASSPSRMQRA